MEGSLSVICQLSKPYVLKCPPPKDLHSIAGKVAACKRCPTPWLPSSFLSCPSQTLLLSGLYGVSFPFLYHLEQSSRSTLGQKFYFLPKKSFLKKRSLIFSSDHKVFLHPYTSHFSLPCSLVPFLPQFLP